MIVTPRQFKQGFYEYEVGGMDNPLRYHNYEVVQKLPSGNYVVVAPSQTIYPNYRQAVAGIEH